MLIKHSKNSGQLFWLVTVTIEQRDVQDLELGYINVTCKVLC